MDNMLDQWLSSESKFANSYFTLSLKDLVCRLMGQNVNVIYVNKSYNKVRKK